MSLEGVKNNSCEFAKNFFLSPQKCSNNIILKVTGIVASIFVFLLTLRIMHAVVGVGYLIYKNYYSLGSVPKNENIEIKDEKNFHKLPSDTLLKIFEFLSLRELGNVRLVNKTWDKQASDSVLLQGNVINETAFTNKNWIKAFGPGFIPEKEINKDKKSLPEDIGKILLSQCQIDPKAKKRVYQTHVFVWIPKTVMINENEVNLTIRTMGQLMKKMFFSKNEGGYRHIWDGIMDQYGDQPMKESGWVLLSRDVIPGTRNKSYSKQLELVKNLADTTKIPYEVPSALPSIISIFAEYIKSDQKTRLLNNDTTYTYTRCKESVDGYQVIVGGFGPAGLHVYDYYDDDDDAIGVVALRKF